MRFDFADPEFRRDPWPAYEALRRAGGVEFSPDTGCYLVTSHAGVKAGLTHSDLAADYPLRTSRQLFGPNMLDTDGTLHRTLKRLVNPFFGASSVNRLIPSLIEPVVRETVAQLADKAGEPFDFIDVVARHVPYVIMTSLMGIPAEDVGRLYQTIRPIVGVLDYPPPPDRGPAEQARDELNKYFLEMLDTPPSEGGQDTIINQFAGLVEADSLSRAHALSSVLLMLVAGTETSISAISNIMLCMLRWPEASRYPVESVVRESLRLEPPLHSVLRFAAKKLEIDGRTIARKRPVLLVLASANRDEAVFPDPDRFDPGRSFRQTMQFGVGSHACPGSYLAEREFTLLFTALRQRFTIAAADPDAPDTVGHVFRRPPSLPVTAREIDQPSDTTGSED